jgi:hypothetical protein
MDMITQAANSIIKNISIDVLLEQEKRASATRKFRFEDQGFTGFCATCGKETKRFGFILIAGRCCYICSSCARKTARRVVTSISMKNIHNKEYSRGVGYGYNLATRDAFGKETIMYIQMIVDDAKKEERAVHFLGRDMDVLFMPFSIEDNTNYLAGWSRGFINKPPETKKKLLAMNNVQEGDFVVDTGFMGSVINDIRGTMNVKGYLLSSSGSNPYTYLYDYQNYQYRDWVVELEHIDRAREVVFDEETRLPQEKFTKPAWYEDGIFHGFVRGVSAIMQ